MNLDSIFNPKSVAIIGASTEVGSVGNDIVKNLTTQGYTGKVFPVNPKATKLYGLKCYPDVLSIPEKVDLAIIAVPASIVTTVMHEVAKKKVKGAIVITAGFKEAGQPERELELSEICRKNNIALIGPNCLGVINPAIKLNASFAATMPPAGGVAFLSQSGALCTAVIDYAQKLEIGFSKFVSVGNKALVDETDLIEYLANDPETKVIALYVEQLKDAGKIIHAVRKLIHGPNPKPVIAIKSGKTLAGASASASHTGALAGNDAAYEALFKQAGIIRAYSTNELFDYLRVFTHNQLPVGNRVAIITNAGGPGVLATDEVIDSGLSLAQITAASQKKLTAVLPAWANFHNPFDILGDAKAKRYEATLKIILADKQVDSVLVILTPQTMTEIETTAKAIINCKKKTKKPIVVNFMGGRLVTEAVRTMRSDQISTLQFPEQAARSLAMLTKFAGQQKQKSTKFNFTDINKKAVTKIFTDAQNRGQKALPEALALPVLAAYKFPLPKYYIVQNETEAEAAVKKINGRVALKIVSPDILHKSDIGGIALNVEPHEVKQKFHTLIKTVHKNAPTADLKGILVMEMLHVPSSAEFILGASKDPGLGAAVMVGLGGIFVEIFKDVSFGLLPLTKENAAQMVADLKANEIICGARGQKHLDGKSLVESIGRLAQLLTDFPQIKEIDINPLVILQEGQGVKALDARIILE
ncbi:MAG: CoA-binding domain protein [Candidatus Magasanikbacteria bacterium GW2011_GWC2_34_16]|uniref:CoA-binding domain protein n=1 Tax=Candidatus Magasanikbacteria bacterium GW2011_GWC2_34_16 TaxID=1619045 RepID=A0A0G0ARU6_9BACT|nr:MAG: CoA-binding domain protein [Candidatus Magasanikbacteria bacterium GW2011_GWC2_34_16]